MGELGQAVRLVSWNNCIRRHGRSIIGGGRAPQSATRPAAARIEHSYSTTLGSCPALIAGVSWTESEYDARRAPMRALFPPRIRGEEVPIENDPDRTDSQCAGLVFDLSAAVRPVRHHGGGRRARRHRPPRLARRRHPPRRPPPRASGRRRSPRAAGLPPSPSTLMPPLRFASCALLQPAAAALPAAAAVARRRRRLRRRRRPSLPGSGAPRRALYFALTDVVCILCFRVACARFHGRRPAPAAAAAAAVARALDAPAFATPAPSWTSKSNPVPLLPAVRRFWRTAGGPGWLLMGGGIAWRVLRRTTAGRSLEALNGCSLGGGCMPLLTMISSVDRSLSIGSRFLLFEGCILLSAPMSACLTAPSIRSSPEASFCGRCWRQLHDKKRSQLTCVCAETHSQSPLSTFYGLAQSVGSDAHGQSLSEGKGMRREPC